MSSQIAILGALKPPDEIIWHNYAACDIVYFVTACLAMLCMTNPPNLLHTLSLSNQSNFTTWTNILHNLCNAGIA